MPRFCSAAKSDNARIKESGGGVDFRSEDWNTSAEDYVREMQRPAVIKEDIREMDCRKRVREVLKAQDFCEELEQRLIRPADVAAAVPIPDAWDGLFSRPTPATALIQRLPKLPSLNVHQMIDITPIPIGDFPPNVKYSSAEVVARNKLATLYRLVDLFHWSQGIYNHITLRLSGANPVEILINPFGLLYHEITASSLIKLNLEGTVLDQGSTHLGVNQAAYVLHSAIHESRPDVHCVLHLHTAVVVAVGSMKCGLLPLCQEAMIIGPVVYHDYQGILTNEEEKQSIVHDLGDKNVLILRNHGFVVCGQSVEDALHLAFHTIIACETQIRASRVGIDNLIIPSAEAALKAYQTARKGGGGVNRLQNGTDELDDAKEGIDGAGQPTRAVPWGIGELEWEAWCRVLDSAGYHTAHPYKQPIPLRLRRVKQHEQRHHSMYNLSSVATPSNGPASVGEAEEEKEGLLVGISNSHRFSSLQNRAELLNSPNRYQKVQFLETGTNHPRVITKWVQQQCNERSAGGHGDTPVKIHLPHQFSPCELATDPQEFRELRRRMKETRLSSTVSPGPRSQVLTNDGRTRVEMKADFGMREKALYIGTASKGIIDRRHQHNTQVYRCLYAPNPFSKMDGDLMRYLNEMKSMETTHVRKSKSSPALSGEMNDRTAEKTISASDCTQSVHAEEGVENTGHERKDSLSVILSTKPTKTMNGHERSASEVAKEKKGTLKKNGRVKKRNGGWTKMGETVRPSSSSRERTVGFEQQVMSDDNGGELQHQQKSKKKWKRRFSLRLFTKK